MITFNTILIIINVSRQENVDDIDGQRAEGRGHKVQIPD